MMRALNLSLIILSTLTVAGCHQEDSAGNEVKTSTDNSAYANEFMVTVTRPGTLNVIDMQQHKTIRQCDLPGGSIPGTLVMSPDNSTAYVLVNRFSDVVGVDIDNCEVVFSAQQSTGNIRVKSIGALALSKDGKRIYTHQNRVKLHSDRYELLEPVVAAFDSDAGLNAQAVTTLPAPRQVTTMDTLESGELLLGGPDIYAMDVNTGELKTLLASRSLEDPNYTPRDVLTVWPLSRINNEFIRLYSTAKFKGEAGDLDNADWLWGYEAINLETGEAESKEFGPITAVLFTGVRRPGHLDKVYATLNQLKEYDISTQTELRSVDLDHTYYCINFSVDGSRIYLSGGYNEVAIYDANTLKPIAKIQLPGDGAMANSVVFKREV